MGPPFHTREGTCKTETIRVRIRNLYDIQCVIFRNSSSNSTPSSAKPDTSTAATSEGKQFMIFQRQVILMTEPGPDSTSQAGDDNSGEAVGSIRIEPTEYSIPGCRVAIRGIGCCDPTDPPWI